MFKLVEETDKYDEQQYYIYQTRGDSVNLFSEPVDENDEAVSLENVAEVHFHLMEADYTIILSKDLVAYNNGFLLQLDPEDTNSFDTGVYYYEIEYVFTDGEVDTPNSYRWKLLPEGVTANG